MSEQRTIRKTAVFLETGLGCDWVWIVWALKPGVANVAAICTDEAHADKYVEVLPKHGGLSYADAKMVKEKVPLDHAFGWRDSVAASLVRQGAA